MKEKRPAFFFPNLDGLRFLCFLSVFLFHSFFTKYDEIKNSGTYTFFKKDVFGNGNIGVNFFFVLSGFLITFLLIKEQENNGKINIRFFWVRRILRIWPLYFFCVFFGFVIFPMIKQYFGQEPHETATPIYYLTFLNNFDFIKNGLPDASVLGVLWSVAIEEQFYFIWPILLFIIPYRYYPYLFSAILAFSLLFRAYYDNYLFHEHHTFSCMGDLCIGAWGAYFIQKEKNLALIKRMSRTGLLFIYGAFIFIFFFRDEFFYSNFYMRIIERSVIAFVILLIILEQNYCDRSFFKMSSFKNISKLGMWTYGLYCLHFIGILITITLMGKFHIDTQLWQVLLLETVLSLACTILIGYLSYNYFEKPFYKLKERFSIIKKQ